MKLVVSIVLMIFAFFVYMFWLSGSHGHIRLRPHMAQDWIMAGIILVCFISSILFFVSWFIKKKKK